VSTLERLQARLGLDNGQIAVRNPISSEMAVMRTSLVPGLLLTALHNRHRQQERVRVFETGLVFSRVGQDIRQERMLGILACGPCHPESCWQGTSPRPVDFYDLKGDLEAILALSGLESDLRLLPASSPFLHPGQSGVISVKNEEIGFIGAVHPGICRDLDLPDQVYVAQLHLSPLLERRTSSFTEVSRFPEVRRDLAVLVDRDIPVQNLLDVVREAAKSYLINLKVFDVYSGEGIDPQRKSVALGLTFCAKSRTLTDLEISESVARVVTALGTRFQAELRS